MLTIEMFIKENYKRRTLLIDLLETIKLHKFDWKNLPFLL